MPALPTWIALPPYHTVLNEHAGVRALVFLAVSTTTRDTIHRAHPHSFRLALSTTIRGFSERKNGLQGVLPYSNCHRTQLIRRAGQV